MRKTLLILLILLLNFNSDSEAQQCASCNKRTHFRFKLLKKQGLRVDTTGIKVNGVYLARSGSGPGKTEYNFLRFFSNGRFYESCAYCSLPDGSELNNLRYGSYGYYRIDSTLLTVETYSAAGGYYYFYYHIRNNELVLQNSRSRTNQFPNKNKLEPAPELHYQYNPASVSSPSFW